LINKADFLSPDLIAHWNQYFIENKVNHIFFSALHEQSKLDSEVEETSKEQQIPEDPD
jgi:ribosome biogenesis GTPase A